MPRRWVSRSLSLCFRAREAPAFSPDHRVLIRSATWSSAPLCLAVMDGALTAPALPSARSMRRTPSAPNRCSTAARKASTSPAMAPFFSTSCHTLPRVASSGAARSAARAASASADSAARRSGPPRVAHLRSRGRSARPRPLHHRCAAGCPAARPPPAPPGHVRASRHLMRAIPSCLAVRPTVLARGRSARPRWSSPRV